MIPLNLPKRRVDRNRVVARKVTRYFVYGRGYNSNLAAHMQIAKRHVAYMEFAAWNASQDRAPGFTERWYAERYPRRPGCPCQFCRGIVMAGTQGGRGCWIAKMADYRQIAREIIEGKRDNEGEPIREMLALPMRSA